MYRYKYTAIENGSKQDFYNVMEELKALYPELTENVGKRPYRKFLQREFVIGENHIVVRYSFSEQSVTVCSEERLEKYYGEREVKEGQFSACGKTGARTMWTVSVIYFAVMALLSFGFLLFGINMSAVRLILAAVYTLSGIIIRRLTNMNFPKLILCQAVGFVTAFAGFMLMLTFAFGFSFLDFLTFLVFELLHLFLPVLAISLLLQGVTELIIKKIHNTKTGGNC